MTKWLRLWEDMPTDPKWRVIARKSGQPLAVVIAVYTYMLTVASAAEERGSISGMSVEDLAAALDLDEADAKAILSEMEGRVVENGRLSGWEKRQPIKEDGAAERAKAWRERQRTPTNATERPDTEERREEYNSSLRSESPAPAEPSSVEKEPDFVLEAYDAYNEAAALTVWPKATKLTPARRSALKSRLVDAGGVDGWRQALARARASPHLTGQNDRGWTADLDFFLQAKSFTKLIEGSYDRRKPGNSQANSSSGADNLLAAFAGLAARSGGNDMVDGGYPPGFDDGRTIDLVANSH